MRYYIVAGERSGDLHGSNLVKALRHLNPTATFRGFGGKYMQDAGVTLAVHYHELAFMGLVELLFNANKIKRYIRACKEDILSFKPDVIILIDYGGFNLQIAKFGKKNGIRVFYYIAPKYWAWYQNRALWLKPNVDRLFVILPFEKEFFKRFNWESDYVGNPVLDAIKSHKQDPDFAVRNSLPDATPIIALLPGSRKQELKSILPVMARVVENFPKYHFLVAAVSNLEKSKYEEVTRLQNVTLIIDDTYNLLLNSSAAIVTSGTATLETGLLKVPQIVVYKANWISYWVGKAMIKVPFISLINLIAGREVIKEMIQSHANSDNISLELRRIIDDSAYRQHITDAYDQIIETLDTGSASENAARLMAEYLRKS